MHADIVYNYTEIITVSFEILQVKLGYISLFHTCQPQTKKNRRFSHAAVPLPYTLVYQLPTRGRTCIYNLPTSHQVAPT